MISSRRATGVVIAICAALCALVSPASAQTSPSATKSKIAVGLSSRKINFGKLPAGTRSTPRTVTLTNKSNVELSAPLVSVTGTGFSLDSNGCISAIPAAGTCPVSVAFTPPSEGKFKNGLLKFTDAAAKSPQKVKLIGVGLIGPSATETLTATPTSTFTPTPTATETGAPTSTATITRTATAMKTPAATVSVTATPTRSATSTATTTPVATTTPTATATATSTATASATSTLAPTMTDTATPTATSTPVFNVVFVSSTTSNGDLGGQAGADAECASLATAASLPSGTYKAWLSTSTANAISKLGGARGFVRPDGQPFADQVSDIATGSDDATETSCNASARIYCFDASHITTLTVTPARGRLAFVSKGSFATNLGLSGADALCQKEGTAAALSNPTQFLALLSTSTASAASRFDMSAMSAPYMRPDGIKIADAATVAAGATLGSGIWQHADSSYVTEFAAAVWTGSTSPEVVGTLATTCQDWTTLNGGDTGSEGVSNVTDTWWDSGASTSCGNRLPVYCLEQ